MAVTKLIVRGLAFPVDGYRYHTMVWRSTDSGRTYFYCGDGKYSRDWEDAERYILETKRRENVVEVLHEAG